MAVCLSVILIATTHGEALARIDGSVTPDPGLTAAGVVNRYVSATSVSLDPGADYRLRARAVGVIAVFLDDGVVSFISEAGASVSAVSTGDYHYLTAGKVVDLTNSGGATVRFAEVQVLALTGIDAPHGSLAEVPLHTLQEQDDQVEIYRVTFPPGAQAGMHHHPRKGLGLVTRAGTMRTTLPDGTARVMELTVGQMFWHAEEIRHNVANIGATPLQVVDIEWK